MATETVTETAPETTTGTPIPTRPVNLTDSARSQVLNLLAENNMAGKSLRLFVESGGCSGFSYGMSFDEKAEDDHVADFDGVAVLVDPKSLPYLQGLTVDYVSTWQETGFKIVNPNAKSTCGCGHSFNT